MTIETQFSKDPYFEALDQLSQFAKRGKADYPRRTWLFSKWWIPFLLTILAALVVTAIVLVPVYCGVAPIYRPRFVWGAFFVGGPLFGFVGVWIAWGGSSQETSPQRIGRQTRGYMLAPPILALSVFWVAICQQITPAFPTGTDLTSAEMIALLFFAWFFIGVSFYGAQMISASEFLLSAMAHYLRHVPQIVRGFPVPEIVDEARRHLLDKSDKEIAYIAKSAQAMQDMTEGRSVVPSVLVGILSLGFFSQLVNFPIRSLVQGTVIALVLLLVLVVIVITGEICLNAYFQVAVLQAAARIQEERGHQPQPSVRQNSQSTAQQHNGNRSCSLRKWVRSLFAKG